MTFNHTVPTALIHADALTTTLTRLYYDGELLGSDLRQQLKDHAVRDFNEVAIAMGRPTAENATVPSAELKDAQDWLNILRDLMSWPENSAPQDIYNAADMLSKAATTLMQNAEQNLS